MTFLDEVRTEVTTRGGCTVGDLMQALGETERAQLSEALYSELPSTAIERAAKRRGWRISAQSIARHRRRACQCQTS